MAIYTVHIFLVTQIHSFWHHFRDYSGRFFIPRPLEILSLLRSYPGPWVKSFKIVKTRVHKFPLFTLYPLRYPFFFSVWLSFYSSFIAFSSLFFVFRLNSFISQLLSNCHFFARILFRCSAHPDKCFYQGRLHIIFCNNDLRDL